MPTLAGINGASLVPDVQGAFQRAGQGVIAGRQFGRDMQADELAQQAAGGDTDALALLGRIDPQAAMITSDIVRNRDVQRARELAEMKEKRVREAALFLNTPAEKRPQALLQLATSLRDAGEDFSHIVELSQMPADRQEMEARRIIAMGAGIDEVLSPLFGTTDAATRNFQYLTEGLSPEEVEQARRIELGLAPRAVGSSSITIAQDNLTDVVADSESTISGAKAGASESAKGSAKTRRGLIDDGLDAVSQIPTLRRTLELLDEVETGGIQSRAALALKQQFGIEGADEGELSANLGKAVLSQLRSTFGAQFTEKEGERLERIEAGFGKSTETNKRLIRSALDSVIRTARRGLRAAERDGDEFAAEEMRAAIQSLEGRREAVSSGQPTPQSAAQQRAEPRPQRLRYNPATGELEPVG